MPTEEEEQQKITDNDECRSCGRDVPPGQSYCAEGTGCDIDSTPN